jgi:hypothetical protein
MYEGHPESKDGLHIAWDILFSPHRPYSSSALATSDFHFITHLKQFLGSTCMLSDKSEEYSKRPVQWTGGRFLQCTHTDTHHTIQVPESSWALCKGKIIPVTGREGP